MKATGPIMAGLGLAAACAALCPTAVCAQAASEAQGQPNKPLWVEFDVLQATNKGKCPQVISFAGRIHASPAESPSRPIHRVRGYDIQYTFLRSDHATSPVMSRSVPVETPQWVGETWTLGGPTFAGWEQLKVWPVGHEEQAVLSKRANFTLVCSG